MNENNQIYNTKCIDFILFTGYFILFSLFVGHDSEYELQTKLGKKQKSGFAGIIGVKYAISRDTNTALSPLILHSRNVPGNCRCTKFKSIESVFYLDRLVFGSSFQQKDNVNVYKKKFPF